jgi:hypothetical protein
MKDALLLQSRKVTFYPCPNTSIVNAWHCNAAAMEAISGDFYRWTRKHAQ